MGDPENAISKGETAQNEFKFRKISPPAVGRSQNVTYFCISAAPPLSGRSPQPELADWTDPQSSDPELHAPRIPD